MKFFQVEYAAIIATALGIAIMFAYSRNGVLRKLLICYFSSVVFCTSVAVVVFTFNINNDTVMSIALFPLFLSSIALMGHLLLKYFFKQKT